MCCICASYYDQGMGIEGSREKAIEMGRLSAAQGNAKAQHLVGCILYDTTPAEAVTFFRGGNADSQFFMGCCYRLGNEESIPRNIIEAVRVFRMASAQKHARAAIALTQLAEEYNNEVITLYMFDF